MKNRAIQYLAPDVHQATVVASLRDESGKILMRATVPTEIKAILTKGAGPRVYVVFEEGTQAQWLHDGLIDHAERVIVCNVRGRSGTTNKSDRLFELLRLGALKLVFHGAREMLTLSFNLIDWRACLSEGKGTSPASAGLELTQSPGFGPPNGSHAKLCGQRPYAEA
jgi:hypothetical protein